MKRKNLVAMGLAGVMAVGMCMPVCAAADAINQDTAELGTTGATSETVVNAEKADKFEVSIPATINYNIESGGADAALKVSLGQDAILDYGKTLKVSVTSPDIDMMIKNDAKTKRTLKLYESDGTTAIVTDIAAFTPEAVSDVEFKVKDTSDAAYTYAGKYEGKVTFTITYKE